MQVFTGLWQQTTACRMTIFFWVPAPPAVTHLVHPLVELHQRPTLYVVHHIHQHKVDLLTRPDQMQTNCTLYSTVNRHSQLLYTARWSADWQDFVFELISDKNVWVFRERMKCIQLNECIQLTDCNPALSTRTWRNVKGWVRNGQKNIKIYCSSHVIAGLLTAAS